MSAREVTTATLTCDATGCGMRFGPADMSIQAARREAKRRGWKYVRLGANGGSCLDICPEHERERTHQ